MDSGFLSGLVNVVKSANKPNNIIEPEGRYLLLNADGSYSLKESQPPRRNHLFSTPETLCAYAERSSDSTIWINQDNIIVTPLDSDGEESDLRDRGTLPVGWSEQFKLLDAWKNRTQISPRELIWKLRTVFAGLPISPNDFLAAVRNVKFSKKEDGSQNIQHGKVSLGRAISAELKSGEKDFPEQFTITVPVLNPPFGESRRAITVVLDVDAASEQFYVQTIAVELQEANLWALEQVRVILAYLLDPVVVLEQSEITKETRKSPTPRLYFGLPELS